MCSYVFYSGPKLTFQRQNPPAMRKQTVFILLCLCLSGMLEAQEPKGAAPTQNPKLKTQNSTRAVVVGISDYQDPAIPDLRFAHRDAESFVDWLQSPSGGSVPPENIQTLLNEQATQARVAMALTALMQQSKPGEQAIVFFSGHGDVERITVSQPGFLLCWDAPSTVYYAGGTLQLGMVQEIVTTLSLQNKANVLMITDACHAGRLAGSEVGGPQATTGNLAKQFANEVKILSCQPNEFSLEGTQWGGGRGCFSYHLTEGLYGLADRNEDDMITLVELENYLEDRVPEETAPHPQLPFVVGNKMTRLARVDAPMLAQIKVGKAGAQLALEKIEPRGMEDWIFSLADSSILELYAAFNVALERKELLEPKGKSANDYYERLIRERELEPLHGLMTRNFAAALLDESQQVTNKLLKTDPQVVSDVYSRPFVFDHIPGYISRAIGLLGDQHFMFRHLHARQLFFEGLTAYTKDSSGVTSSERLHTVSDKMEAALQVDSNAAFIHAYLCHFYTWFKQNQTKSLHFADKVIELAPNWVVAQINAASSFGYFGWQLEDTILLAKSEECLLKALNIDSTYLPVYQTLSWYYWDINPDKKKYRFYQDKLIHSIQNILETDSSHVSAFYRFNLGVELCRAGRNAEAAVVLETCEQMTHQKWSAVYTHLGVVYYILGQYEKAFTAAKKQIELNPFVPEGYIQLAKYANRLGRPLETIKYLEEGLSLTEIKSWGTYYLIINLRLGEAYQAIGREEKAKEQFKTIIDSIPVFNYGYEIYIVGAAYLRLGNPEMMQKTIEEGRTRFPDDPWTYYQAACLYSLAKQAQNTVEWLEKALEKNKEVFNLDFINNDADLENIRDTIGFKALLKKYFSDEIND